MNVATNGGRTVRIGSVDSSTAEVQPWCIKASRAHARPLTICATPMLHPPKPSVFMQHTIAFYDTTKARSDHQACMQINAEAETHRRAFTALINSAFADVRIHEQASANPPHNSPERRRFASFCGGFAAKSTHFSPVSRGREHHSWKTNGAHRFIDQPQPQRIYGTLNAISIQHLRDS